MIHARSLSTIALSFALSCGLAATALAQDAPLQAQLEVTVEEDDASSATASDLDGGNARVRARFSNVNDTTLKVTVRFGYRIPPDTIALDEIIDLIRFETETLEGEDYGLAEIDPNEMNLNPNSRSLKYQVMMNRPEGNYRARVTVFGNYE